MITQWHHLVKQRDIGGLDAILADDVVLHSPVVHTPLPGKAIVRRYLSAAFSVFINDSFHYVREVISGNDAVLEFCVEIDGLMVNGVDMIRWNDEDKIVDFKVMLRPLKAVNLIHAHMGAMLEK